MFKKSVFGFAALVLATNANGQVSSSLTPLSEAEEEQLVDAYVMHRVCQPYVAHASQIYARELLYKAGKADPKVVDFFKGVEAGLMQHPEMFKVTAKQCDKELPTAFQNLELFKRIIGK